MSKKHAPFQIVLVTAANNVIAELLLQLIKLHIIRGLSIKYIVHVKILCFHDGEAFHGSLVVTVVIPAVIFTGIIVNEYHQPLLQRSHNSFHEIVYPDVQNLWSVLID